jgi:hypothetical protein
VLRKIPVVVVSGNVQRGEPLNGIDAYLEKPVSRKRLIAVVEHRCEKHFARAGLRDSGLGDPEIANSRECAPASSESSSRPLRPLFLKCYPTRSRVTVAASEPPAIGP